MTNPNPTVLDELRSSPIGSYLDTPVTDVLSNLGLPQLPQLPSISLPDLSGLQLPTLPTIDLTSLISPVTSLLQSFGTGSLSNSSFNPATILTSLVSALTSAVSQSKSATNTVMNTWTGDAALAAKAKSEGVEAQSGEVAAQGVQQHGILLEAEAIVAEGYSEMTALIASFVAQVTGAVALLATPAGIPWLIETATTTINAGMAIAAKTSAQLAGSTAQIVEAGTKIMIAGAPIASNIETLVNMVGTALQPIASVAPTVAEKVVEKGASVVSTGVSDISSALSNSNNSNSNTNTNTNTNTKTNQPTVTDVKTDQKTDSPDTTKTDGGGGSPLSTIFGGTPTTTTPASPTGTSRIPTGEVSNTGAGIPKTTTEANGRTTATTTPSVGAAGAAGRAGAADEESTSDRSGLVTGAHGDEVVGVIEGVVLPVVGAIEAIEEPPDKALTL
ncbi:hypothetical protein [Nocardia sp. CDC160]|uniref:hypothetical protein n=1 Tax=Nocardia sp. CDC160 TaxID=3112166 RepID=UPI002DC04D75|nr:hypothetical protein [Nocardia sp. CDC160]MEC3913291.1 hypothetical protein [Nocardia sp. CDC160]